jgi:hypothetical protein
MVGRCTAAFDSYPNIIVTIVKLQAWGVMTAICFCLHTETAEAIGWTSELLPKEGERGHGSQPDPPGFARLHGWVTGPISHAFFGEIARASSSFGGGRLAPPVASV